MQRHSPHSAVSQPIYSNLSSRKTIPGDVRPGNVFYSWDLGEGTCH